MQDRFRDGVVYVVLDAVTDAALVPRAIADALGLEERATPQRDALVRGLQRRLERRRAAARPRRVRARPAGRGARRRTARRRRRTAHPRHEPGVAAPAGRARAAVAPLELEAAVSTVRRSCAQRAPRLRAGRRRRRRGRGDLPAPGPLPLAVELAAARTKLLSPRAIAARLENRLELLTGGARRPAFAASDAARRDRLDPRAARPRGAARLRSPGRVRRRLHAGGRRGGLRTAGAGRAAGCPRPRSSTRACSCGVRARAATSASSMLQTIREYARYRLIERGELDDARGRHAERYPGGRRDGRSATARRRSGGRRAAHRGRDRQRPHRARVVAGERQVELGLRIAGALARFWSIRDQMTEGRAWLRQALARARALRLPSARAPSSPPRTARSRRATTTRPRPDSRSAWIHRALGDRAARRGAWRRSVGCSWRAAARTGDGGGDAEPRPGARESRTARRSRSRSPSSPRSRCAAATASARSSCSARCSTSAARARRPPQRRNALLNLGRAELVARRRGAARRQARGRARAGTRHRRHMGNVAGPDLARALALDRGDVAGARSLAADALESCQARGDRRTAAECLSLIAVLDGPRGRPDEAARLRAPPHGCAPR